MRIDKWLWAARFAKTRSAATDLVLAGHVKVGGERVKPAREITIGDTVEIRLGPTRRVVVVTGLADRRGPAKVAATLYEETPASREERERLAARAAADPSARRRPRRAPDEAGATPARRAAPGTAPSVSGSSGSERRGVGSAATTKGRVRWHLHAS